MSKITDRIAPEILAAYPLELEDTFRRVGPDMAALRAEWDAQGAEQKKLLPPFPGSEEVIAVPGLNGAPDVPVRIYRHEAVKYPDAAMIWVHGGGYVIGAADDPSVYRYAPLMPVFSVEYRMAPEHRSPAAAEDTCAAIDWVAANAPKFGIDPGRLILGGPSGGGGLAASAALMNRDRGGPSLLYQYLVYPMIDDTHGTPSGHLDLPGVFWTRDVSLRAWSMYAEEDGASCYAAAARATDLSGLPPAYVMTGDLDLFRDESIAYAQRLMAAGVPVDLAVFPGAPHGFDLFAPDSSVGRRAIAHQLAALEEVLQNAA